MNSEAAVPRELSLPKPLSPWVQALLMIARLTVFSVIAWSFLTSEGAPDPTTRGTSSAAAILDIAVLVFREGLECILVLSAITASMLGKNQHHRKAVALGAAVGAVATIVTWFIAHHKLPYRKMLEFTGILLGVVLLVMVGEQAQEMQLARWIPTTTIPWLEPFMPDWLGLWFSVFPTVETLVAQGLAAFLVVGSFFLAKKKSEKDAGVSVA